MGIRLAMTALLGLAAGSGAAGTIKLADGTLIQGEIVERKDSLVVIQSKSLGKITVPERELAEADRSAPVSARVRESALLREPSDQALFFMPTAFTPPAGSFTFRDFELFFLTLGYSPTDATSITGGFLFPISAEFQVITAGAKQRLWQAGDGLTAAALTANFTKPLGEMGDDLAFFANSNLVLGRRGQDGSGVHAAIGYLGGMTAGRNDEWNGSFTYALGGEKRLTPHVKAIAEFLSAVPYGTGADIDGGLLTVGIRLHGERLSADIAGTRPLTDADLGGFLFWPLLLVSYRY